MDTEVNRRLKELRFKIGKTQQEMAKVLATKKAYYSDIENNRRGLSERMMNILHENFLVSKAWLKTGEGSMFDDGYLQKLYPEIVPYLYPEAEKTPKKPLKTGSGNENFYLEAHFEKKLLLDLKNEKTETAKLFWLINNLVGFQYIIDNLHHYYFKEIEDAEHSASKFFKGTPTDYQEYKAHVTEVLNKYINVLPALENIDKAINAFYADFKSFDSKKIIEGYFGGKANEAESESKA